MPDDTDSTRAPAAPFVPDPRLVAASRDLIRALQDPGGAYPASPHFSAYQGHSWFRDGAFIAEAARRHGDVDGSARFHSWCVDVVTTRADHISALVGRRARGEDVHHKEMLPTRFTFDGSDGTDDWWDFQLDGYGTWLWALAEHTTAHGLPDAEAALAAGLVMDYLASFWDLPCYDWWEEHVERRHVATLGAVRAGLDRALSTRRLVRGATEDALLRVRAAIDGIDALLVSEGLSEAPRQAGRSRHLVKWKDSDLVDASLLACVEPYRLPLPAGVAEATVEAIEQDLAVQHGVHRYLLDTYYGGGQWPLLSAFLACALTTQGRLDDAGAYLRWVEQQADAELLMPEQARHHLLAPEREQEWIDRWGPSAHPLLWSHAMYLIACDAYTRARQHALDRSVAEVGP